MQTAYFCVSRILFVSGIRVLLGFLESILFIIALDEIHLGKFKTAKVRSEDKRLRLAFLPSKAFAVRHVEGSANNGIRTRVSTLQFRKGKIIRRIEPRERIGVT